MTDPIRIHLAAFADKFAVPAVGGGILTTDGVLRHDVIGVRRRGGGEEAQSEVQLDDAWHIGSCAKSITAVLYARLVERGDAAWNQPAASLFADLAGEISAPWHDRTVEELFLCSSGMQANPDKSRLAAYYADTRPLPQQRTDAALAAMRQAPGPRGRFVYSNLSYMVIGAAIDRITGMPYEAALAKYVLDPLGITTLGYGPPATVCGHKSRVRLGPWLLFAGDGVESTDPRGDNPAVLSSAGTMHLTLPDWAKFLSLFITHGGDLLQAETIDYLLTNPQAGDSSMTMGWANAQGLPGASYGMQGSNTLWSAAALLNTARNRLSFVACNDGRTRVLMHSARLAAVLLDEAV